MTEAHKRSPTTLECFLPQSRRLVRTELAFLAGAGTMGILAGYGLGFYAQFARDLRAVAAAAEGVGAAGTILLALTTIAVAFQLFWRAYTLRNPHARLPWKQNE